MTESDYLQMLIVAVQNLEIYLQIIVSVLMAKFFYSMMAKIRELHYKKHH